MRSIVRTTDGVSSWNHSDADAGSSGSCWSSAAQPRRSPTTSCPSCATRLTTALMHGLSPGTSPPPVRIPMRIETFLSGAVDRSRPTACRFTPGAERTLTMPPGRRTGSRGWWNGRHGGLKSHCPRGREGSSPSPRMIDCAISGRVGSENHAALVGAGEPQIDSARGRRPHCCVRVKGSLGANRPRRRPRPNS